MYIIVQKIFKITNSFLKVFLFLSFLSATAQEVKVIDNKGTIETVRNNNVITGALPVGYTPLENDIWFDTTVTPTEIRIYNDSGVWVSLASNIYTIDGTLTGDRTMTMGTNTLTFLSNTNTRSTITLQRTVGSQQIGIGFRNPDNSYKAAISMPSNGDNKLDFFSGDSPTTASGLNKTMSLLNNNQIEFSQYDSGNFINNSPDYFLGVNSTGRVVQINPTNVFSDIYRNNGTLTGERTMTMDGNQLNFNTNSSSKTNLTLRRDDENNELGIGFRNSGGFYNAAMVLSQNIVASLDFYSGGSNASADALIKTLSLHDDNQIEFSEYGSSTPLFLDNAPEYFLGVNNTGEVVEVNPDLVVQKGTEGSIFFADDTDGSLTEDNANLFWDDTNNYLGVGTDTPNSTIQINGSVSKPIEQITSSLTLDDTNYSIIVVDPALNVLLPTPNNADNQGREYVIKNATSSDITTSSYLDNTNTATTLIPANNVLKVQSLNGNWHQMNNYSVASGGSGGGSGIPPGAVLATNYTINGNVNDVTSFTISFNIPSSMVSLGPGEWGIAIMGVPYQTIPATTGSFTYSVGTPVQNADGITWDHFLTGTSTISQATNGNSTFFTVTGAAPSPPGSCFNGGCGDFVLYEIP